MSQHARIEEISDSDSDPSEQDPSDFVDTLIRPSSIPPSSQQPPQPSPQFLRPQFQAPRSPSAVDSEKHKRWQCLYAVYFDANRSRAEGRRVGKELAVMNPLAREIVDAVQQLGLDTVFEPGKMHPRDWANPGRVRCCLMEGGKLKNSRVKNKHHLYILVAKYLKAHPTTEDSPLRLRIAGVPVPDKPIPPPAVPRGWKMGSILPLHSPALSGGGVSENIIKEMMQEMQGAGGPAAMLDGDGGQGKKKKEKKKVRT